MLRWLFVLASLWMLPRECAALSIVRVVSDVDEVQLETPFSVEIRADLGPQILGFGLDFDVSPSFASPQGPPSIGSAWLSVPAADGDGLAGIAFPLAVTGENVLLATVWLVATSSGEFELTPSVSPGDQAEGFALDPTGFDSTQFVSLRIRAVSEPSSLPLGVLAFGALVCAGMRRAWGQ